MGECIKKVTTILTIEVLIAAVFGALVLEVQNASAYTLHPEIYIDGDDGFNNPLNGVSNWDDPTAGTAVNPYIIEGWEIIPTSATGMTIKNTRAHAIIRDNYIHDSVNPNLGVILGNVTNITIKNNELLRVHHGIELLDDAFPLIDGNNITMNARGIQISPEANATIKNNHIEVFTFGIIVDCSPQFFGDSPHPHRYIPLIENNTITNGSDGIHIEMANATVMGNEITNCWRGIFIFLDGNGTWYSLPGQGRPLIDSNVLIGNEIGIRIGANQNTVPIRNNLISSSEIFGIWVGGANPSITNNTLVNNPLAIKFDGSNRPIRIENNTLRFNLGGIYSALKSGGVDSKLEAHHNDIYDNYWFAIRNDVENVSWQYIMNATDNYFGGTPNDDGDWIEGPVTYSSAPAPFNPSTPALPFVPHVVTGTETITGSTTLDGPYIVRKGGSLTIQNATLDLNDFYLIGSKPGGTFNILDSTLTNGFTIAVHTDSSTIDNNQISFMREGVAVYESAPTVSNNNISGILSVPWHSMSNSARYVMESSGIWMYKANPTVTGNQIDAEPTYMWGIGMFVAFSDGIIAGNTVYNATWGGIHLEHSTSLIKNNILTNNNDGILALFEYYGAIENNTIENNENGIYFDEGWVYGWHPYNRMLSPSGVVNNTVTLNSVGIGGDDVNDAVFSHNTITDNANGIVINGNGLNVSLNLIKNNNKGISSWSNLLIDKNNVTENNIGIGVSGYSVITNNNITLNNYGILTSGSESPRVQYNNIFDNYLYGVNNSDSSGLVDAELNWWGDASGPYDDSQDGTPTDLDGDGDDDEYLYNPSGTGDNVTDHVDYVPWLTEPSDQNWSGGYNRLPEIRIKEPLINRVVSGLIPIQGFAWDADSDYMLDIEVRIINETDLSYDTGWQPAYNWLNGDGNISWLYIWDATQLSNGLYCIHVRSLDGLDYSLVHHLPVEVRNSQTHTNHAPITINGNSDFTSPNGVSNPGAAGTEGDPYIIEGWDIDASSDHGILIQNTDAYAVIRNSYIHGGYPNYEGIRLESSDNITIEENMLYHNRYNTYYENCNNIAVQNNSLWDSGDRCILSTGSVSNIENNILYRSDAAPDDNEYYIYLRQNSNATVKGNVLAGYFLRGINLFDISETPLIENNIVLGCGGSGSSGAVFAEMADATIINNVFADGGTGLGILSYQNLTVTNNLISTNGGGIYSDASNAEIHYNNIVGNLAWGIYNGNSGAHINATYNYWGADDGPSGHGPGSGDSVTVGAGGMDYDPWLTEPIPKKNTPPTISLTEPDGVNDVADQSFTITWSDYDPDDDATVTLYYTDNPCIFGAEALSLENNVIPGAEGISENDGTNSFVWDTSALSQGSVWYVWAMIDDGFNDTVYDFSPYYEFSRPITIDHTPSATVDYIRIQYEPGAGGEFVDNPIYLQGEIDTFYGAEYNNTHGYVGEISLFSSWLSSDSTIVDVTSVGSYTDITCSDTAAGTVTIYVDDGEGHTNQTQVTVLAPSTDYIQIRDAPNGGGNVVNDPSYPVGAIDTFYGAAYNHTKGYLGDVPSGSIWMSTDTTIVDVTTPGASTTIACNNSNNGTVTITLDDGEGHSNTTLVTVIPPTVDFIQIRDAPNGGGDVVNNPSYPVGAPDEFYGAEYNGTGGYIGDVSSSSTWASSNSSVVSVTSPGNPTTILCSDIFWGTVMIELNDGAGHTNQTDVTVLRPTTDYVIIRDAPDNEGNIVDNPRYPVGATDTFYGAGYNHTAGYIGDVPSIAVWSSDDTTIVTVASPGSSTTIICSYANWGAVSIELDDGSGHKNQTQVTVIEPTLDFIQIRNAPNGQGDVVSDVEYPVGAVGTLWGAVFNHTAGYLGDVPTSSTWTSTDPSIVDVTNPGISTDITCSDTKNGTVTITLDDGNGQTNTTQVTVLEPTVDSLKIMDAAGGIGNEVINPRYPVGATDIYYGAMFNDTTGYIGDVPSTAIWTSSQTRISVTTPGDSTVIVCSDTDSGTARITLDDGNDHQASVNAEILPPTADYIQIQDDSGVEGNHVEDHTTNLGASETYYAVGYNYTAGYLGPVDVDWDNSNSEVGDLVNLHDSENIFTAAMNKIGITRISIRDNGNEEDGFDLTIVDLIPPTADAGYDQVIDEGDEIELDGSASEDNVETADYEWTLNKDGDVIYTEDRVTMSYTFSEPGTYEATLNVTDTSGNYDTDTITITVEKGEVPPPEGFPLWVLIPIFILIAILILFFILVNRYKKCKQCGRRFPVSKIDRETGLCEECNLRRQQEMGTTGSVPLQTEPSSPPQ